MEFRRADTIVQDYELGAPLDEIQESFPALPLEAIKKLLAFARLLIWVGADGKTESSSRLRRAPGSM
jgi:hypothetical protein